MTTCGDKSLVFDEQLCCDLGSSLSCSQVVPVTQEQTMADVIKHSSANTKLHCRLLILDSDQTMGVAFAVSFTIHSNAGL